jgi:hypothetical protein
MEYRGGVRNAILAALQCLPRVQECYDSDARIRTCIAEHNPAERLIAFSGTDNATDVLADFWANRVRSDLTPAMNMARATVHEGFLARYREWQDQACIFSLPTSPRAPVTLVGHSMGGVFACFTAYLLVTVHRVPTAQVSVVALGMPRAGNAAWMRTYDAAVPNTLRVETLADPVPRLPPPWGWRHVGTRLRLNTDGEPTSGNWSIAAHALACLTLRRRMVLHSLPDYRGALLAHLARLENPRA